jgi:hypothetical protein
MIHLFFVKREEFIRFGARGYFLKERIWNGLF